MQACLSMAWMTALTSRDDRSVRRTSHSRAADDLLLRIPTWKHHLINGWYSTRSREFGGMSSRDYLRGKAWAERMRVGRQALTEHGVLLP